MDEQLSADRVAAADTLARARCVQIERDTTTAVIVAQVLAILAAGACVKLGRLALSVVDGLVRYLASDSQEARGDTEVWTSTARVRQTWSAAALDVTGCRERVAEAFVRAWSSDWGALPPALLDVAPRVLASSLDWGYRAPSIEAPALWGARLLIEQDGRGRRLVSCLGDRQSLLGEEPARQQLRDALSVSMHLLVEHLRREVSHYRLREDSVEVFDVTFRGVRFQGSPNGSYGYVYVTGRLDPAAGPSCDGCGCGGTHGTKAYPGLCPTCRDERKDEARQERARTAKRRGVRS